MALKITPSNEPLQVSNLNFVVYAQPGIGKTSLAFTASKPLLFDFDNGAYRAPNRKDIVSIDSWADIASLTANDLEPYSTVIIDTVGRALDMLTKNIIESNPKLGSNGSLTMRGWGELKSRFTAFLKLLNTLKKDIVLIAHMGEQTSTGDEVLERLDVQGGSKGEIYKTADVMGRIYMRGGDRILTFSPSDTAFGKNPAQLPSFKVPDITSPDYESFFAKIIAETKSKINELTAEQKEFADEIAWFNNTVPDIDDLDGINNLIERAKKSPRICGKLLADKAKELGFVFNKTTSLYEKQAEVVA